jgi:hypothetical protein
MRDFRYKPIILDLHTLVSPYARGKNSRYQYIRHTPSDNISIRPLIKATTTIFIVVRRQSWRTVSGRLHDTYSELNSSLHINRAFWHTRSDISILCMAAACRWYVEPGKLMYRSTFGHVPVFVYKSHRPIRRSFAGSRGSSMSVVYCWRKNEYKFLEQRRDIKFRVKADRSASET